MPLTEMNKNIIKWGLVGLVGLGLIIAVVFLLKKSSQTNSVTIKLTLQGPYPKPQTATMSLDKGILPSLAVGQFIGSVIQTTKILPWSINNTYWIGMSISGKTVQISDGKITDKAAQQNLYNLLGISSPPTSISLSATYKNSCSPNNYPTNLDPCLGQTGVCTSTGWTIVDYQYCPPEGIICCTDPDNPYQTCGEDKKVVCKTCPGTIDCGEPGCGLIGPKCTATGWVCAPGYACPTGPSLNACCTGTDHATCTMVGGRANLVCSGCTGTPPSCTPDCNMCGLVCNEDGTWSCRQGAYCPSESITNSCCTNPDNPHSYCSSPITNGPPCTGPAGNVGVKCDNCQSSTKPPDPKCIQGSCEGHGYVCTSTGWICAPGVTCPDPTKFGSWQQCCPTGYMANNPYCDPDSHCIKCGCPVGYTGCGGAINCGAPHSQCNQICCENDIPCNQTSSGECLCCPKSQICNLSSGTTVCCGAGEICSPGVGCVAACGIDPTTGTGVSCNVGETCIVVDNLTPAVISRLKQEYGNKVRFNSITNPTEAFLCLQDSSSCNFNVVGGLVAVPAAVQNYYPCYNFPTNPTTNRAGYCTEKDNTSSQSCAVHETITDCKNADGPCTWKNGMCLSNTSQIANCFPLNPDQCSANANCTWRDVMKYMTTDSNPRNTWKQIQIELATGQGDYMGHYCASPDGTPYQRVVVIPGNTSCSVEDCWGRFAQPGLVDMEFGKTSDGTSSMCVALQPCNPASPVTTQTYAIVGSGPHVGEKVANPDNVPLPPNIMSSTFVNCSTSPPCPDQCDPSTGRLVVPSYICASDPQAPSPGQICQLVYDGSGNFTESTCGASCSCAPDFQRAKSDNKCYHKVFESNYGPGACNTNWCAAGSCSGDDSGCHVAGWQQTCHGSCFANSCQCDCFIPAGGIPNNYMYCEYGSKSWKQCQNSGGCSDPTQGSGWGHINGGSCMERNDESSTYCTIPL